MQHEIKYTFLFLLVAVPVRVTAQPLQWTSGDTLYYSIHQKDSSNFVAKNYIIQINMLDRERNRCDLKYTLLYASIKIRDTETFASSRMTLIPYRLTMIFVCLPSPY